MSDDDLLSIKVDHDTGRVTATASLPTVGESWVALRRFLEDRNNQIAMGAELRVRPRRAPVASRLLIERATSTTKASS